MEITLAFEEPLTGPNGTPWAQSGFKATDRESGAQVLLPASVELYEYEREWVEGEARRMATQAITDLLDASVPPQP